MWCAQCQLDAPALAVPEEPGVIRCAFCKSELTGRAEMPPASHAAPIAETALGELFPLASEPLPQVPPTLTFLPPPPIDEWQGDAELRAVERLVTVLRQSRGDEPGQSAGWTMPMAAAVAPSSAAASNPIATEPAKESASLAAWACLTLGLMAFACGGVLVLWSLAANRNDLWSVGLPLALAGQVGLVLGLLLQLDGISASSRRTEQTLTDLDSQLGELRSVTSLISSSRSGPSHSFYAHLTDGASPQILLSDLKGQLDLLAQQMARQKKAA